MVSKISSMILARNQKYALIEIFNDESDDLGSFFVKRQGEYVLERTVWSLTVTDLLEDVD